MQRLLSNKQLPEIQRAFEYIPDRILNRIGNVDFLCEVDPVFVGLHNYKDTKDGRKYNETAHCVYNNHQFILDKEKRKTTICLPKHSGVWTIIHELGHVLHEVDLGIKTIPITEFAKNNKYEAFAESFCAWIDDSYTEKKLIELDPETYFFFNNLWRN